MDSICLKSHLFQIEEGEDEETNPYRYGRQLAQWLKEKLEGYGYTNMQVIPEDWGWCVLFEKDDVTLLVGCGNMEEMEFLQNPDLFKTEQIVWSCFVEAKVSLLQRLIKRIDPQPFEKELSSQLNEILRSTPEINIIECP